MYWGSAKATRRHVLPGMAVRLFQGTLVALALLASLPAARAEAARPLFLSHLRMEDGLSHGDALAVLQRAAGRGIYLRDRSTEPGCEGCLRVSAGVVDHTDRFIALMDEVL